MSVPPEARSCAFEPHPESIRAHAVAATNAMYVPALMRFGVLTGGGDCPGLNAVIRAIVRKGVDHHGHAILGFRDGWRGPIEDDQSELTIEAIRGILPRGGTILGSSRTNPFKRDDGPQRIADTPSSRLKGFVREEPRIVPPRGRMPRVDSIVSSS